MDQESLENAVGGSSWDARLNAIRAIPNEFAGKDHPAAYAAAAGAFYKDKLAAGFHQIPWLDRYADHDGFIEAYSAAAKGTNGFTDVTPGDLERAIRADSRSLRIFRLLTGYKSNELAEAVSAFTESEISKGAIESLEEGKAFRSAVGDVLSDLAEQLHAIVAGTGGFSVADPLRELGFRGKTDKPDTEDGWNTVADWHANRVPYAELLYQRFYGGAFRQLQDAGGSKTGDLLEDATEKLFQEHGVPYIRSVPGTQGKIGQQFGVSIRPAPDFVIHNGQAPKALLECKSINDGGTARDKASRFHNLREEGNRLNAAVIGVLDGLGWRRLNDALGPVIRDTGGLVFSAETLDDLVKVEPVKSLVGTAT